MKKSGILFIILLAPFVVLSQVTVSKTILNFPSTEYKNVADLQFSLINDYSTDVDVVIRSYDKDFYVDDTTVTLTANSSQNIPVHFKPVHNITYNSELVIITNSKTGSFSVDLKGTGKYDTYYGSTFDLFEQDLKAELKTILAKGYTNLGYNAARDAMYGSIDNHGGYVECVYTGRQATFNTRTGANYNSFNCEHTWPQSLFNENEPEKADIHHLFPTDVDANSRRSNYPFGTVSSVSWTVGGSKLGGNLFEPRDAHKGDVARAMFYFAIRYQNYSSFLNNQESLLRSWASTFQPSQASIDRNNAIFAYQKNRNPFVDYPEYLSRITSISTSSAPHVKHKITPSTEAIHISSISSPGDFIYQLVLTNSGNQTELFTGFSNKHASITLPKTAVELTPGESHTLKIKITPSNQVIKDTLVLSSSDVNLTIPLSVIGLSNVTDLIQEQFFVYVVNGIIKIHNANLHEVVVYNSNGQKLYFNDIQSDLTEIHIPHLASGVYFVQAIGKGIVPQVYKIIIP